jgi:hypothetical protein
MTSVNGTTPQPGPPTGINPTGWAEPFETWPAEVVVSEFRLCTDEYMAARTFRPALPRAIWQWALQVKRLDERFQLLDGSAADMTKWGGYDLERLNTRATPPIIETINLQSNKEALISNAWIRCFSTIEPPETLIGKKAMFEFYPSKRTGRNVAKNILLPVTALAPDYVFPGEITVRVQRAPTEGSTDHANGVAEVPASTMTFDYETALVALVPFLDGVNSGNLASIVPSLPANVRTGQILQGLVDGSIVTQLQNSGVISVTADGTISVVGVTAGVA